MEDITKGSFEGWNSIWDKQSTKNLLNKMFSVNEPKTIFQFWQKAYATDLLSLIKDRPYSKFCELGSGRGTTSMYLSHSSYTDITMVDLAPKGFEVAKYSFEKFGLKTPKLLLENIEHTSLESDEFDCIYNIGLLEHFEDPSKVLKESYRLLKEDGLIFMPIVPIQPKYKSYFLRLIFNPKSFIRLFLHFLRPSKLPINDVYRNNYNRKYYVDICEKLGFKNVKCVPYNPYWKVNGNGWFEDNVTLPVYKWHYRNFKMNKVLSLKTNGLFDLCFLLIAEK